MADCGIQVGFTRSDNSECNLYCDLFGVTEWGLYVELNENKCEGLVPIRDLGDDFYDMDEETYSLIGRRKKRRFRLGDPVTVKIANANLERKQLDFMLME